MFLNNFDFSRQKQDEIWVSKGEEFAKGIINRYQDKNQGAAEELGSVYEPYATFLLSRFDKSKDKNNLDAALIKFDKAISLGSGLIIATR